MNNNVAETLHRDFMRLFYSNELHCLDSMLYVDLERHLMDMFMSAREEIKRRGDDGQT